MEMTTEKGIALMTLAKRIHMVLTVSPWHTEDVPCVECRKIAGELLRSGQVAELLEPQPQRWACLACSKAAGGISHVSHAVGEVCPRGEELEIGGVPISQLRMKPIEASVACDNCGAAVSIPPRPAMLKVDFNGVELRRIEESLTELERLAGDAPHRAIATPERMKALFWMVAREVANRAYQGAWNQATDGQPVKEHHFKAFTRSVIDGQVPRSWEPKP